MDARRLAVELQLSAKRGTVSGEQVNAVVDALLEMTDKLERLEAENAKLRELVRYMHRCYVRGHDWGPYGAPEKEWVEEQMRDLGIEAG